jgi:hypothetical protein
VAEPPELLSLERHRDLRGRENYPWARWILLTVLALFLAAGLANVFGQHPAVDSAESAQARLEVMAPTALRAGLYFESRFTIEAKEEIASATIVLDEGWLQGTTLNTVEPSPVGEASRNGRIALDLGRVAAGARHVLFLQFQVNPTDVGRREAGVELTDGETHLLSIPRTVTVYP